MLRGLRPGKTHHRLADLERRVATLERVVFRRHHDAPHAPDATERHAEETDGL